MVTTEQDVSKKILSELSNEDYNQELEKLKSIQPFDGSECHPISDATRAVMVNEGAELYKQFFDILKLDWRKDENLKDTPFRVVSMIINELTIGRYTPPPRIEAFPANYYYMKEFEIDLNDKKYAKIKKLHIKLDETQELFYSDPAENGYTTTFVNSILTDTEEYLNLIKEEEESLGLNRPKIRNMVSKTVDINSLCSHHLIPFVTTNDKDSKCVISYVPKIGDNKALLGISKLQRVADWFGRRPQLQETLNWQIRIFLSLILRSLDVMVSFQNVIHYCEKTRGVKSHCGSTSSIEFAGKFDLPEVRDLAFRITKT